MAFSIGFALIGLNRGVAAQMVQSALPPLLSLTALLMGLNRVDTLLCVYAASYTTCCCLGAGFILHDWHRALATPVAPSAAAAPTALPTLWTTARPFLVIELVQVSLLSIPVLALGAFVNADAVGTFSIISRLTMIINTILISLGIIAAPAFARHHRRHEYGDLRRVNRQTWLLAMVICLPIIALMMFFPRQLLSLLGHEFASAWLAMIVLAVGQLVNVFLPTQDTMLAMTGHGIILRRLNLQQLAVCCVLAPVLIPAFGLMGAAILSSISLMQGRVSFALAVRRVLPELVAPARPVAV